MKKFYTILFVSLLLLTKTSFSQSTPVVYPRIAGYAGIVHPILTFDREGTSANFDGHYVVGMPVGINLWKTPETGFSLELVPSVRAENGTSKMNNLLIHPGILLTIGHGFTFAGRAAFETSGRYGFTPVFNKIIKKNKNSGYFVAVPLPVRFGNDKPAGFTIGFQFGITF